MSINLNKLTKNEYQIINREDLLKHIDSSKNCLEIGALCNPFFDHSKGNTKNADVYTKNQLIELYKDCPERGSLKMNDVDYIIDPHKKYTDVIDQTFDIVFSSHVIEHQACLITHLENIESILKQNGCVILYIPDKRYCFDHFHTESSLIDVLAAFYENRWNSSFKSRVLSSLYKTHNYPLYHWHQSHGNDSKESFILKADQELMKYSKKDIEKQFCDQSDYVSAHNFYFTPDSFKQIIGFLHEKKYINLQLLRLYQTPIYSNEFLAILVK